MVIAPRLETDRLILRPIDVERDFEAYAAMMADEETAHFIGGVQDRATAWRAMCSILGHWRVRGYGFFTVEEKATGDFVGRVGPWFPEGWPDREIGWTIVRSRWGRGYAAEAATAALDWVFDELGWDLAIHTIEPGNAKSVRVAEKLGSVNTGRTARLPPFDIVADVWSQTAADWRARRGA